MMGNEGSSPSTPHHLHTIFVDTSIDTHLALIVSLQDTISDVKRKIIVEHAFCFQDIGEITIQAIKVKRRGFFYNLADSMHVLNAFDGVTGSWFVCIDAVPMRPASAKYQKALANKIAHEHTEHLDFAGTVCDVHNKHQETAFCLLSPKNQDSLIKDPVLSMVMPDKSVEPENQKSLDASVKEFLAHDCPSLQIEKSPPTQGLQVCSTDVLIPGDGNIKALNGLKVNEVYLHDGVAVSQSKPEKNSGPDGEGSQIQIVTSIDCGHRPEMLINQENDGRRKKEPKNLGIEARDFMPSTRTHKTRSKKMDTKCKDGLHEENLEEKDDSSRSANLPPEISCNEKMEILAVCSDGLPSKLPHENTTPLKNPPVEKNTKKRRKSTKSNEGAHLAMPCEVRSSEVTADANNSGKEINAPIYFGKYPTELIINEPLSNDNRDMSKTSDTPNLANQKGIETKKRRRKSTKSNEAAHLAMPCEVRSSEVTADANNSGKEINAPIYFGKYPTELIIKEPLSNDNRDMIKTSDTPNLANQNEIETKKRRRKSTKSNEGAHLAMPCEVRSSEVTADANNSGKEINAPIYFGKYPTELIINEPLSNDNRDMSKTSDAPNLANQKEIEQSMETCLNIETKEVQTLQVNSIDRRKNHVNLGEEDNLGIIFKGHGGEAKISSQESPTMLSRNIGIVKSQSSKILPHNETNNHQNMEFDALKCITELNVREVEAGSIDAKEGIPMSPEVFTYQEQISNVVSKDSLIDKCHDSGKETEAAANPNGANKEIFLAQVDSNVLNTSKRRRKKSKIESSRVLQSPLVNVNDEPLNFNGAQVFLTDIQNDSNATLFIKQADQKVIGGHNLDTMIELSTSSQKLPNQDHASHMNSGNPPISLFHSLSKKSSESVEKTVGIKAPSQPAQAKEHRSRKKSKGEKSKIYSSEISDVMLPKFNGNVSESNDERGSAASKLDNAFNHRIEQRCIDSMATVPLSHEDFPTIVTVQHVNPLDSSSCKPQDLSGHTNAKVVTKQSNLTQCGDLATPTKSKRDRRKSRKEVLEAQVSSEMTEHLVVAESNDGRSDPSKLDNMFNPKMEQHCIDAKVTVPLSHEDFPTLVKVHPVYPLDSSSCKPHDLSAQTNSKVVTKQSDVAQPGDLASPTKSKRIRKKSKTEVLEAQISSEMCEHLVVAESNEGRSDPSKLDNMLNQKMEQHCVDARVTVPLSHEDFSTLDKISRGNLLDSSSCKPQDLSGQTNAKILTKQNDVTKYGDFADPIKSKRERKKSKKEVLEARVSSEKSEHLELHREFVDYFVPKEGKCCPDVHATSFPSGKSETRRKRKNGRKTDLNQPYQDSPTNLVQSSSHKQDEVTGQIQVNDSSDYNAVDASRDDADKDSKIGNVHKAIKTKQSSKLKLSLGRVESDSSLHKVHDNQKHDNKLQESGSQSHVQLLKSGEFQSEQEKRITADWKGESQSLVPDHDIDNMVSKDCDVQHKDLFCSTTRNPVGYSVGSSNFDFFPSEDMDNAEASSDSTEDNPDMRYRVVRKLQRGSSKKIINSNLEKLASPGRRFSDASGSSSDSGSGSYINKATIRTGLDGLSTDENMDSHLEEVKTKANALKLQTDAGPLDTEANKSGEDGKDVGSKAIKDHNRSAASTQKVRLSTILKSSSSYKKARLTASQSEFVDYTESQQPIESQLETEP